MKRYASLIRIVAVLVLAPPVLVAFGQASSGETVGSAGLVTVRPEETDELLANPGMGWETFHTTRDKDRSLPDWIPSTVHYARWGWGTLEPEPGEIDYAFIDRTLLETRAAGQQLAFRAMCCSTSPGRPYHPDWLEDVGGKVLTVDYGRQEGLLVPDLDDPDVLARHLHFIRRLGARYDGHPDIDHVDLGSVGWWGEWHMSGSNTGRMPTEDTCRQIIDAYLEAFRKTPVLMLIGGREFLSYAAERGAGWRADCLGDMGGFSPNWCHMRNAYVQLIQGAEAADVWKTAPVAWETCWDMRRWFKEDWPLRYIFNYALAFHGSYINNKSAPLPEGEDVRHEIGRFLRRLGYRFVLREFRFPKRVQAGAAMTFAMSWQNVGSAPCYRPYRVAYRLSNEQGCTKTLVGTVTADQWMPGTVSLFTEEFLKEPPDLPPGPIVEAADSVTLPADVPPGEYRLAVGIVGEHTAQPVVRLAIEGQDEDGWYPLGKLTIAE